MISHTKCNQIEFICMRPDEGCAWNGTRMSLCMHLCKLKCCTINLINKKTNMDPSHMSWSKNPVLYEPCCEEKSCTVWTLSWSKNLVLYELCHDVKILYSTNSYREVKIMYCTNYVILVILPAQDKGKRGRLLLNRDLNPPPVSPWCRNQSAMPPSHILSDAGSSTDSKRISPSLSFLCVPRQASSFVNIGTKHISWKVHFFKGRGEKEKLFQQNQKIVLCILYPFWQGFVRHLVFMPFINQNSYFTPLVTFFFRVV